MSTFVPVINPATSPALYPAQGTGNNNRIYQNFVVDHIFNTTAQSTDGYHKIIHSVTQSGQYLSSSPAATTVGQTYTMSQSVRNNSTDFFQIMPFFKSEAASGGREYCLGFGMKAFAVFYWDGSNIQIMSSFNVSSVVRTARGLYTVNFAQALPDNNYLVQCNGAGNVTGLAPIGDVIFSVQNFPGSSTPYNTVVSTTFVKVFCGSNPGSSMVTRDPRMYYVQVMGV